jgi:hypothetical protein
VTRLVLALAVAALVVVIVKIREQRRGRDAPTQPQWQVPSQLDLDDVGGASTDWCVVVFSSSTCATCADVVAKASVLASPSVAVHTVDYVARPDLHKKYAVDAVPITVLADRNGSVVRGFVGPVSATDLWAAMAQARDPHDESSTDICAPSDG